MINIELESVEYLMTNSYGRLNSKCGVYKILCNNGKFYIGSSKDVGKRLKNHFNKLKSNKHKNPFLQNAYNKYGVGSFYVGIIEECDILDLRELEQYWMDVTKCYDREVGFNNCKKSDRPLGYKHTDECKARMSKIKSEQIKLGIAKMPIYKGGYKHTQEFKDWLSNSRLGKNNPRYGVKEDKEKSKTRMANMISSPKWNSGLTKETDSRIEKLGTWKGKSTPNSIKCKLIDNITGQTWEAESIEKLSKVVPISVVSLRRLKYNKASKKLNLKYKLEW